MIELIAAYGFLGFQQGIVLLFSLARTKIISGLLGPIGMGLFAQANNFVLLMYQVATFGTGIALNTLVSEYKSQQEEEKIPRLLILLWVLNSIVGLLLTAACFLFAEPLSAWIFGMPDMGPYLLAAAVAGFVFIQVRLFVNLLRGMLEWKSYSIISSSTLLLGLGVVVILVVRFGLAGAVWSLAVIQVLNLSGLVIFFFTRIRKQAGIQFSDVRLDLGLLKPVLRIAQPIMLILILEPLSRFLIRTQIVQSLGADLNGQYQVLAGISLAYINVIKEARLSYTVPKSASVQKDAGDLVALQNNNLRLGLYLVVPLTIGVLAFREVAVNLLYSTAFQFAAQLLIWQFLGDIFFTVRMSLNFVLIPLKRYPFYLAEGAAYWVGWYLFSLYTIPRWGLIGVPIGHLILNVLLAGVTLIYHRRVTDFRLSASAARSLGVLAAIGSGGYLAAGLLPPGMIRYLLVLMVLGVIVISVFRQGILKLIRREK